MTQYGYEPLSPDDSGSTLLGRVNGVVPALLTNHKGAARPGYVQPGMLWIDDSGASWLLNLYDGASDINIAAINPVDHTIILAGRSANTLTPFSFTAAAGQTVFDLGISPSPNACIFSQNGSWLVGGGADYAIAGSKLTLTLAAGDGDRIVGVAIASFEVANALVPAANLADLADIVVARNNLGLRSAATKAAGDPGLMPSGSVIGRAYNELVGVAAYTATIPFDNTIPQNTEGLAAISVTYTPKVSGSKLHVKFLTKSSNDTGGYWNIAAAFLNNNADAFDMCIGFASNATALYVMEIESDITPSGLTPQTISIRVGNNGGTTRLNVPGANTFGNIAKTTLIVEEIAP